jgi:hypothetical protein
MGIQFREGQGIYSPRPLPYELCCLSALWTTDFSCCEWTLRLFTYAISHTKRIKKLVCSELKWAFTCTLCLLHSNSRNLQLAYKPIGLLTAPGAFSKKYLIILVAWLILFIYTVTSFLVLKKLFELYTKWFVSYRIILWDYFIVII